MVENSTRAPLGPARGAGSPPSICLIQPLLHKAVAEGPHLGLFLSLKECHSIPQLNSNQIFHTGETVAELPRVASCQNAIHISIIRMLKKFGEHRTFGIQY